MRGLGLSEMTQIRQLLLEFEGRPLGGYLVDVFDRVLQHEIESQEDIIEAARKLDTFGADGSGPPYISGQMQFQNVVKRMATQATERLRLGGSPKFPLTFGDVLIKCTAAPVSEADQSTHDIGEVAVHTDVAPELPPHNFTAEEIADGDLLLAVTAACDLARGDAESILFLKGKAEPISEDNWLYRGIRSPAVELDGTLCRIDWDLTKYETMRLDEATARYFDGSLTHVARLRDQHAIEVQQKFLASLGRVGLPAHLPATVPIEVRAYYYTEALTLTALATPEIENESRCFVGRDKNSNQRASVVLSETGCDQLLREIDKIDLNNVAENARRSFEALKSTNALHDILKDGVEVTNLKPSSKVVRKVESKHGELPAITLVWNGQALEDQVAANHALAKGLILTVGTREDSSATTP